MSKLNTYPTDDVAADANIFNFWNTVEVAVKKTTWGNIKTLLIAAFSASTAELIAGVSTVKYATVALLFDKLIFTYDATKAYPVGITMLYTDWNLYKVLTATTAGQTPGTNPAKFQLLGVQQSEKNTWTAKQDAIVPASGYGGNIGTESRAGLDTNSFTGESQTLAAYVNAIITDLKTKGIFQA